MKKQNSTLEPILLFESTSKINTLKNYVEEVAGCTTEIIQAFKDLNIEATLSHDDIKNLLKSVESVVKSKIEAILSKDKSLQLGKFKLNKSSLTDLVELPDLSSLQFKVDALCERLETFSESYKRDDQLNTASSSLFGFVKVTETSAIIDEEKLNQYISSRLQVFATTKEQIEVYNAAKLIAETLNNVIIPACRERYLVADHFQGYSIDLQKLMNRLIQCKNDHRKPMIFKDARPEVAISEEFIRNLHG